MRIIQGTKLIAYDCKEFDFSLLDKTEFINKRIGKDWIKYNTTFGAFDIETSNLEEDKISYIYHWQFCFSQSFISVYGRTINELVSFFNDLREYYSLGEKHRFVIYVHNLSYEYQFIKDFIQIDYIFKNSNNNTIYQVVSNGLEFKCSYQLTNQSLYMATKNELGITYIKSKGDLDFSIIRTTETRLDKTEFAYCMLDVVCLVDLIQCKLINENRKITDLPLTATGYIRELVAQSVNKDYHKKYSVLHLYNDEFYTLAKQAVRGGNVYATEIYRNNIYNNVNSYDFNSSYPSIMLLNKFPMKPFAPQPVELFNMYIDTNPCLFTIAFKNIRVKPNYRNIPYIAVSKINKVLGLITDKNKHRLLSADKLQMTITDIDYKIISKTYTWDKQAVGKLYTSEYGYLPKEITDLVYRLYQNKCDIKDKINKGDNSKETKYNYRKAKERLNSLYGLAITDPLQYTNSEKYNKSKKVGLSYVWGIWISAIGRFNLQKLIHSVGINNVLYIDTDCVKVFDNRESNIGIEKYNNAVRKQLSNRELDLDIGLAIKENKSLLTFKTLDNKKYCCLENGEFKVTVAGLLRERNNITIEQEIGNINNFNNDYVLYNCGKNISVKSDIKPREIKINGVNTLIGSYCYIETVPAKLGINNTSENSLLFGIRKD